MNSSGRRREACPNGAPRTLSAYISARDEARERNSWCAFPPVPGLTLDLLQRQDANGRRRIARLLDRAVRGLPEAELVHQAALWRLTPVILAAPPARRRIFFFPAVARRIPTLDGNGRPTGGVTIEFPLNVRVGDPLVAEIPQPRLEWGLARCMRKLVTEPGRPFPNFRPIRIWRLKEIGSAAAVQLIAKAKEESPLAHCFPVEVLDLAERLMAFLALDVAKRIESRPGGWAAIPHLDRRLCKAAWKGKCRKLRRLGLSDAFRRFLLLQSRATSQGRRALSEAERKELEGLRVMVDEKLGYAQNVPVGRARRAVLCPECEPHENSVRHELRDGMYPLPDGRKVSHSEYRKHLQDRRMPDQDPGLALLEEQDRKETAHQRDALARLRRLKRQ